MCVCVYKTGGKEASSCSCRIGFLPEYKMRVPDLWWCKRNVRKKWLIEDVKMRKGTPILR